MVRLPSAEEKLSSLTGRCLFEVPHRALLLLQLLVCLPKLGRDVWWEREMEIAAF